MNFTRLPRYGSSEGGGGAARFQRLQRMWPICSPIYLMLVLCLIVSPVCVLVGKLKTLV